MSAWVPPTTPKTIIFPWNQESKGFYAAFYEPEMTNGKVSLQEINQFISDVNVECNLYKKWVADEESQEGWFGMLIAIIILADLWLFFSDSRDDFFGLFTNGEMIILTWFFFPLVHRVCGWKFEKMDFQSHIKEKLQDMFDKENESLRSRNLKWHLPDKFPTWLELTKDMKKNNNDWETPYSIPHILGNPIIFLRHRYKSDKTEETWRFSYDSFSPALAGDRISFKEVQELLSEINALLRTPFQGSSKGSLVFLCLSFELFGLLFISNHFSDLLTTLQSIIIAVVSALLSLPLFGYELEREDKKRDTYIKAVSQSTVDKYNETLEIRGLKWQLPDQFPRWIELHKNPFESIQLMNIRHQKRSDPLSVSPQDDAEAQRQNDKQKKAKKSKYDMYAPLLEEDKN